MKTSFITLILFLTVLAISCSHEPEPINFNSDQCVHCKMTIEDTHFGAEIVSKKGKVFKFDAVECLIKYINKGMIQENEIDKMYVIDFSQPSKLVDAVSATYLISPNLQSPMGANLSAFLNNSFAENQKNSSSGDLYNWNDLKLKFKK